MRAHTRRVRRYLWRRAARRFRDLRPAFRAARRRRRGRLRVGRFPFHRRRSLCMHGRVRPIGRRRGRGRGIGPLAERGGRGRSDRCRWLGNCGGLDARRSVREGARRVRRARHREVNQWMLRIADERRRGERDQCREHGRDGGRSPRPARRLAGRGQRRRRGNATDNRNRSRHERGRRDAYRPRCADGGCNARHRRDRRVGREGGNIPRQSPALVQRGNEISRTQARLRIVHQLLMRAPVRNVAIVVLAQPEDQGSRIVEAIGCPARLRPAEGSPGR